MNHPPSAAQRRRITTRAAPLAVAATIAFIAGAVVGDGGSPEKDAARRFTEAWIQQDFTAMHAELTPAAQAQTSAAELEAAYTEAQTTATVETIDPGEPQEPSTSGDTTLVEVPVQIETLAFGTVTESFQLPVDNEAIAWDESLAFPGLGDGEELTSDVRLAKRAPILARDGTPLAEGPALERSSPLGTSAIDITGEVGDAEASEEEALAAEGFPPGTPVGITGVERAFNSRLAGKPGGELLADSGSGEPRVLASDDPAPGKQVKTTVDPDLQAAAVTALAGRVGGIAVLDARDGSVRALAGQAFSNPRPPGSTFKIITATAALETGVVTLDEEFPVLDGINVGGRFVSNASGEFCGGTFEYSFAHSCNSVFAPLGVEVGESDLVAAAESFGFNEAPTLYNEETVQAVDPPEPSIPLDPGDELDVGVSAIGQGEVLSTPLEMASVAQTVASGGVRAPTQIVTDPELGPSKEPVRVMSTKIAGLVEQMMIEVVVSGTGVAGAIPEAQVAGKTGTAELGPAPGQENEEDPIQILDAWFAAYAPADKPRLAIAVMLNDAGADGGEVAAPTAAQVLSAGI